MKTIGNIIQKVPKENVPIRSGKISDFEGISIKEAKWYFKEKAESLCPGYVVDEENRDVIVTLLHYFTNNPEFREQHIVRSPSLKKGILLAGNIGTGKTLLMQILRDCRFPDKFFGIKTCREVSYQYASEGIEGIAVYGSKAVRMEHGQIKPYHLLFDDLGAEQNMNHYGNKMNVMAELLLDRYEHFLKYGLITHLTTNLDLKDIEKFYGNRVLSRMHQMFNFISLGGNKDASDRRILHNLTQ